jgi:predicted ATPase
MTALTRGGEPARALSAYDDLRSRLADQLGADPAPDTQQLHLALLRGEAGTSERAKPASAKDELRLAGRGREYAQLLDAWSEATSGHGSLVLISGEAGVGKTRLASEVERLATATGGAVLSTRCYEAERSLFLQPVTEAISSLVTHWSAGAVRDAASEHAGSLARLVPEIGALLDHPHEQDGPVDVERRRAFAAVSAFLTGIGRQRPVLLVLDDLHNAGRSTVELLHFLRLRLPNARLLVLATIRAEEGGEVLDALADVATRIELGPLPATAVRQLAAAAGQSDLADEIVRRTGGHALFVVEILRGLDANEAGLPQSLQAAVLARVARTGRQTEIVLRAGAVLGSAFDPRTAAVLAGVSATVAISCGERALTARLVVVAGRQYEFANDMIREVLYATTPEPTRAAQHARALDILTGDPELVAFHASAIEDWPRSGRAWLLAAEQALRRFAAADAVNLATRALETAERIADTELRGRALILRARAHDAESAFEAAWADLGDAVDAAREAGDQRLEMAALREIAGDVSIALGLSPASCAAPLRRGLAIAETLGDRVAEANFLDRLSVIAATGLDFVGALDFGQQALRAADACGEVMARWHALDALKSVYAYLGETVPLAEIVAELEPMQRRSGDLWFLQWTIFESAYIPLAAGDYAAATMRIEAALAVNRRSGYAPMEAWYVAHLGWVRRLAGDLAAARAFGEQGASLAARHGHAWWSATATGLYAGTLLQLGARDEAKEVLERVLPAVERADARAYLLRCLGPLAEASESDEVLRSAAALVRSIKAPDGSAWLAGADAYLGVARAYARRGEPDQAQQVLAPFVAAAERVGWTALVRLAEPVR